MRLIDADFMKESIRLTQYANKADKAMVEDIKKWIDNQPTVEPLKEQEAVEPKQVDLYDKDEWWGFVCVCPDCKAEWMSDKADTHFCPKCGRAVKWDAAD